MLLIAFVRRSLAPARRCGAAVRDDQGLAAPHKGTSSCVWASGGSRRHRGRGHGHPTPPFAPTGPWASTSAGLPRVHDDHGAACRGQGARPRALQAPGGFSHQQGRGRGCPRSPRVATPLASWAAAQRAPEGRRAMSHGALATSLPTNHGTSLLRTPLSPTWRIRAQGHQTPIRALGGQNVTTHATLRSRGTKAQSVCHVPGRRDGEAPTSLLKDTRQYVRELPGCTPSRGHVMHALGRHLPPSLADGQAKRCAGQVLIPSWLSQITHASLTLRQVCDTAWAGA